MYSPTTEDLGKQAIQYLKDTRQFSSTVRNGELEGYVKVTVGATEWAVSCMMAKGEMEDVAWVKAIRRHILHREDD